ncbi:hypothetical protein LI82_07000 [Methanococcoides methylutens]|uniref:N-acetyltransferase domain-containing protein n=1 Tax=Methanococcoides methylutens TaxID=2226 RepID=A0A099T0D7_METMT|nr:GNAT family N-acetyltransferase [Methanococcoides methylutens]KGK98610.1 hypothetical protein LI82_07000 [Methanococcoides methylutens]
MKIKMNDEILNNLYEFWTYIGEKTDKLDENKNYSSISLINSDYPNRVFSVSPKKEIISEIIDLSQKKLLPNIITIPKTNDLENHSQVELLFRQMNMALELKMVEATFEMDENIHQVRSRENAFSFAETASEAFGTRVDGDIIYLISKDASKVRMFNYTKNGEYLGCGIVFFDSNNIAGFHMIGTIPKGRGQGIGTKITEKLIMEAKTNKNEYCVLHASLMGEKIYKKLGFVSFEEIETYQIIERQ